MKMSKIESAMRTVLAFNDAFNRHDIQGMVKLVSDDFRCEDHSPAPEGHVLAGKDEAAQYWQGLFQTSPGARKEIEEIFGLGERCVMRWRMSGLGPEGALANVRGADIFRVRERTIREQLSYVKS